MVYKRKVAFVFALAGGTLLLASLAGAQTTSTSGTATPPLTPKVQQVVEINPAGRALLRGTVVSVGSGSLVVKSWGGNWTVNVTDATEVIPKATGTSADLSKFSAGDFVGVNGSIIEGQAWTIEAKVLRNWTIRQESKQERKEVRQEVKIERSEGARIYVGTAGSVGTSSLTLTERQTSYTVNVAADAKVLNRNWLKINLSDIRNRDLVRVFGVASGTTITASVVRDTSLPVRQQRGGH